MKIISLLIFVGFSGSPAIAQDRTRIVLESSFPEGFGRVMKIDSFLKMATGDPRSKLGAVIQYYLVDPSGKNSDLLVIFYDRDSENEVAQMFMGKERELMRVAVVGYEGLRAGGVPSIGKGVDAEEIELPAGVSWRVEKVFYVMTVSKK